MKQIYILYFNSYVNTDEIIINNYFMSELELGLFEYFECDLNDIIKVLYEFSGYKCHVFENSLNDPNWHFGNPELYYLYAEIELSDFNLDKLKNFSFKYENNDYTIDITIAAARLEYSHLELETFLYIL